MNRNSSQRPFSVHGSQTGLALVSALLMLLIITLLGVSLFLGVSLQQRAAGNSMQKTRALELAQSATAAAERWLDANHGRLVPVACSATVTTFRMCISPPSTPADPSTWVNAGATHVALANVTVNPGGGPNTYYAPPAVWITFLGRATMGPGNLYEIDAQAYSGNANTLAVTQAVYYVGGSPNNSTPAQNLGQ